MSKTFTKFIVLTVIIALSGSGIMLQSKADEKKVWLNAILGGTLDPAMVPKYVSPLVKPPVMPRTGKIKNKGMKNAEYYEIAVRQFQQQILPASDIYGNPIPMTTVWSYGPADDFRTVAQGGRYFYPAFTIEA